MEPDHGGILCKTHRKYHMTCDEYEALRARAGGRCEVCRRLPEETGAGKLFIDHDYRYGLTAVRGLLCGRCNTRLGMLEHPDLHPEFNRHDPRTKGLDEFRRNAWFLQVVRWARTRPAFLDIPHAHQDELIEGARQHMVTRFATKRIGAGPAIRVRTVIAEGSFNFEVETRYALDRGDLAIHFIAVGPQKVAYVRAAALLDCDTAETSFDDWRDALRLLTDPQ